MLVDLVTEEILWELMLSPRVTEFPSILANNTMLKTPKNSPALISKTAWTVPLPLSLMMFVTPLKNSPKPRFLNTEALEEFRI